MVARIQRPAAEDDGMRVLVDRLWPRGIRKADARLDLWAKDLAPTAALRAWFDHDPGRFDEFRRLYLAELRSRRAAAVSLLERVAGRRLTLLTAVRDERVRHAEVLRDFLLDVGS